MTRVNVGTLMAVVLFSCSGTPGSDAGVVDSGQGGGGGGAQTGGGAGGGGGGNVLVDAGFDAGPVSSCLSAPPFTGGDLLSVGYTPARSVVPQFDAAYFLRPSATASKFDLLSVEYFFATTPTLPAMVSQPQPNYQHCDGCVRLSLACDSTGNGCALDYLAQAGTVSITALGTSPDAGTFGFALTDVHFEQWDFGASPDVVIDGGSCLILPSLTYSGSW
jgi:hypothetical protein